MRGQGRLFRPKVRGEHTIVWWLDYTVRGERRRESTKTTSRKEALDILEKRRGDRKSGRVIGNPEKVTLAELKALSVKQYDLDGRRSKDRLTQYWAHLVKFFGAEKPVAQIIGVDLGDYRADRLKAVSRQTVNNELSALRRAFRLAIENGLLAVMPVFKLPKVANARSGFFEDGEFAALLLELPADVRDLVQFLRETGWRRDEARLLTWAAVDMEGGTIRLGDGRSKSGKPRVFPFGLAPTLKELLDARWAAREGLYVFHRDGEAIGKGAVRSTWRRACVRAGLATVDPVTKKVKLQRIVHDLRRSAARDFRRAGVSEGEVMKLCGWETRAMFDRYNIIDEADLAAAVAKRFAPNGKQRQTNEASTSSSDSVTSTRSTS